jgi:hypothetical protein
VAATLVHVCVTLPGWEPPVTLPSAQTTVLAMAYVMPGPVSVTEDTEVRGRGYQGDLCPF